MPGVSRLRIYVDESVVVISKNVLTEKKELDWKHLPIYSLISFFFFFLFFFQNYRRRRRQLVTIYPPIGLDILSSKEKKETEGREKVPKTWHSFR